jgi:hypothetical protein
MKFVEKFQLTKTYLFVVGILMKQSCYVQLNATNQLNKFVAPEPKSSSQHSQQPAIAPYPKPGEPTPSQSP